MESITIKDIARICGVGVTTVSRAINNHPDINPETKARIQEAIKEYNYIPNNSARNLKRVESKTVAILMKGITNTLFQGMIQIFETAIQRERYSCILHMIEEDQDEVDVALQLEKEKRLRGIVFLGGEYVHSSEKLNQIRAPYVLCTFDMCEEVSRDVYSSITVNDYEESYRLVSYLIQKGHRQIALLAARENDVSIGRRRLLGYKQALQDSGIEVDEALIVYPMVKGDIFSYENGYMCAQKLLKSGVEFTAVYAIADNIAFGACRAIFDAGKNVPNDYSVVGFDGIEMARYYCPTLTTMAQPYEEMAKETIELLFDLIYKRKKNAHRIFEARIMEGESVRGLL